MLHGNKTQIKKKTNTLVPREIAINNSMEAGTFFQIAGSIDVLRTSILPAI